MIHVEGLIYGCSLLKRTLLISIRLKKEMVNRVNQVASEFRKVSNKQMAETTKRTIRDNVSINAQLDKMSDKTTELIAENDDLRKKNKEHRQKIEMLEENEKEILKKNHSNQKVVFQLFTFSSSVTNRRLFTKQQNFKPVQIQSSCIRQNDSDSKIEICVGKNRKHCGKRRKFWLPAFSPFPTMFSKAFLSRGVKNLD